MQSHTYRLDRFISARKGIKRSDVRVLLAQGRIKIDGKAATTTNQIVGQFTHVLLDGEEIQANTPLYIMLNKPAGFVSATRDDQHRTVIDLLRRQSSVASISEALNADALHIAGRLDFNSTGLVLLTNDGHWSRRLSEPKFGVIKRYVVTLEQAITDECVQGFKNGLYFKHENLMTRPAHIECLPATNNALHRALVSLSEGRYHQIKRMFGQYRNKVLTLHRVSVGSITLDLSLKEGRSRLLYDSELSELASLMNQKIVPI